MVVAISESSVRILYAGGYDHKILVGTYYLSITPAAWDVISCGYPTAPPTRVAHVGFWVVDISLPDMDGLESEIESRRYLVGRQGR